METLKFAEEFHRPAMVRWSAILLVATLMQSPALPSLQAAAPAQEMTDSDVTYAVEDALVREKGVFPDDVDVNTKDGIVTLSGSVDNLLARNRVVKIAESVRGVLGVIGEVTVQPVSRPDEAIRKDILTALLQDPATDSYQVSVSVHDAVATLTGNVGSYAEKRLAEYIAEGVKGVKEIHNRLAINYLTVRTDQEIAADVNARLKWDIWINGGLIKATVKDGVVTLTGTVGSAISKSRAFDDAWVNGVTSVDDSRVNIQPLARNEELRTSELTIKSNSEIKQAVRTAFRFDPRVAPFSPDVNVEDGVVILGGPVGNVKAKTAAEQDARNIVGVWRVENFLKVRPKEELTDAEMEKQLKAALFWDPLLEGAKIDVAVINHVAYLSGEVESGLQKSEAQDVASRIKGVVVIRNRLAADPEFSVFYYDWPYYTYQDWTYYNQPPYTISETFSPQAFPSDRQIKTKIERELFWSPFVDRNDVKVKVDGGVAILTGNVGTWIGWAEANRDAHKSGAAYVINRVKVKGHALL